MSTGEIVAAVIGPLSFGLFLYFFDRINRRKPQVVHVKVEKKVFVPVVVGSTDNVSPLTLQEAGVMPATGANKINVDIKNCPRCGEDHEDVEFDRFGEHPINGFTHYGKCPSTEEPILVRIGITDDSQPLKEPPSAPSGCTKRCAE